MNVKSDIQLINLNSSYATLNNSTYLSDVVFSFKGLAKKEPDIISRKIIILNAQIPVSFYNINYSNNVLNYSVSSVWNSITVPVGNYNANSLITVMTSLFLADGYTITITINKLNGILTFTATTSFTFNLNGSTIFKTLGLSSAVHNSLLNIITCDYPLNLLGIKNIKIKSKNLSILSYDCVNKGLSSTLTTIPVDSPSFGLILYENKSNDKFTLTNDNINEIDIQLCDENNTLINFNNCEWSMTLIYEIIRKQDNTLQETIKDCLAKLERTIKQETTTQEPTQEPTINDDDDETTDLDLFLYNSVGKDDFII